MGIACTKFSSIVPFNETVNKKSFYLNSLSHEQNNKIKLLIKSQNENITIDIIASIYTSVVYTDNIFFLNEEDKKKIICISKIYNISNSDIKKWRQSIKSPEFDPKLSFEQIMEYKRRVIELVNQYKVYVYNNIHNVLNDKDKENIHIILTDNNLPEQIIKNWNIYITTGNWPLPYTIKQKIANEKRVRKHIAAVKKAQVDKKHHDKIQKAIADEYQIKMKQLEEQQRLEYMISHPGPIKEVIYVYHNHTNHLKNPMMICSLGALSATIPQLSATIPQLSAAIPQLSPADTLTMVVYGSNCKF